MAWWPLHNVAGANKLEAQTYASSWPPAVTATASGTAHTKGAWAQVVASTAEAWDGFWLGVNTNFTAATNTAILLDIGTGAAASEVVQISNLSVGNAAVKLHTTWVYVPLSIPASTRIAVRIQSAVTSKTASWRIVGSVAANEGLAGPLLPSFGSTQTYGALTASSRGTTVTASATINTLGAWTQLVASSTDVTRAMLVRLDANSTTNLTASSGYIQIGVGAAASEVQVGHDVWFGCSVDEWVTADGPGAIIPIYGLNIPAGSRISARISSLVASQALGVSVLAFT